MQENLNQSICMELSDSGTESLKLMIIQLIQNQKLNNIRDRGMNGL